MSRSSAQAAVTAGTGGRIAVLADIHGNRWALEAVLEEVERRGIRGVVTLGDALYGPLDPGGTGDLLVALGPPSVRGNEDRIIVEAGAEPPSATLVHVQANIGAAHRAWLSALPATVEVGGALLCHGTPSSDCDYLLWEVGPTGASRREPARVAADLSEVAQPLVLCGHDHVPAVLCLSDGQAVVDPGSVGLPAYTDGRPWPHAMESGSPHARFAVVERGDGGWTVEQVAVAYDWEAAARTARRQGREDWEVWLRTGMAR